MKPNEQTEEEKALEQAQALIQAKENEKAKAFLNDYKELSAKYGYQLSPKVITTINGTIMDLEVIKLQ